MSGFLAGHRKGSFGGGSLAKFAARAVNDVEVGGGRSPSSLRAGSKQASPNPGGIIDALRGAVQERDDALYNPRTEAAAALSECQSTLDEQVREALSALLEPLVDAASSGARGEALRDEVQDSLLECNARIMRRVTACTEELQEADTSSTKIQLKLLAKKNEDRLVQARKANSVQLANKQQQLEHEYKQDFKQKVKELVDGGGNSASNDLRRPSLRSPRVDLVPISAPRIVAAWCGPLPPANSPHNLPMVLPVSRACCSALRCPDPGRRAHGAD